MSGAMLFVPAVAHGQTVEQLTQQINDLLALIEGLRLQLVNLGGTPGTGGAFAACTFTKDLTLGSKGADVKCLQQGLNASGYPVAATGAGSPGNETEYFGALTKAALGKWQAANNVSPPAGYFGPITRNKIASLGGGVTPPPPGTIPPPATGLLLSIASDNPLDRTLPKGATGAEILKFNVSGSGTLDSLTFKRMGIGATGDWGSAGFYLYEGTTRLTSGKSLNTTTHELTFVNLALPVSGTRTLTLVGDVAQGATASNQSYFDLIGSTGSPNPAGALKSNKVTIGGQNVGGLDPASGSAPPNPKIGEQKAWLAEIRLTASSTEDVLVHRLALTEGGSISNDRVSNFVLEQNDQVVATAASIGAKDLVTLVFTTPFKVEKGQNRLFKLYGDISGNARADDTIVFYIDSVSDVYAIGATYGFPVTPGITGLDATSDGDTITVEGGQITITFNGPITGDVPLRGQDITLFDFTIAAQNNVEIKTLKLNATAVGVDGDDGFNDFKVWDVVKDIVISSALDIATSNATTRNVADGGWTVNVTDIINLSAGQTKRMKVTADIDSDTDSGDTIQVSLQDWANNAIRNLDNNTNVATSTIVPAGSIAGNTQTVRTPALDIQLAATPGSQFAVRGSQDIPIVGFSFRAVDGDIKITTIRLNASGYAAGNAGQSSSTAVTLVADWTNLALYDGTTRVSDFKGLTGSAVPVTATFTGLNYTIPKGVTKVLTVKGNLSTDATVGTSTYMYITSSTSDITVLDSEGNTATVTGVDPNFTDFGTTAPPVLVRILSAGDVTVAQATVDNDTKPYYVVAGTESTLGKFKFTSTNEAMTINKLQLRVSSSSAISDVTGAGESNDAVGLVKLYDGSTLIGNTGGYQVQSDGVVIITNLGWTVPKDGEKVLTVKGVISPINIGDDSQADAGENIYVHVSSSDFEAVGASAKDTALVSSTGNQKVLVKNYPTFERLALPSENLSTKSVAAHFRVRNSGATPLSFKSFMLKVGTNNASVATSTTANVDVYDMSSPTTRLTLTTVSQWDNTELGLYAGSTIGSNNTGYVLVEFTTAEEIAASGYSDYQVSLNFGDISATANAATIDTWLYISTSTVIGSSTIYSDIICEDATLAGGRCGEPSFVWSDHSKISHSETTQDWNNGAFLEAPATAWALKN